MSSRLSCAAALLAVACLALALAAPARALTLYTDQLASPSFLGLGVEFDPYDNLKPAQINWSLIEQRLNFMSPGLLRVVEPASDYFAGYDSAGNPTYRWTSQHVTELLSILSYAQSNGITVVLGDWGDPVIGGDASIPIDFISQLRSVYGYTNIRYYNVMNEPNGDASCQFACWTGIVKAIANEIDRQGDQSWLKLVGPDNANSWDDTAAASEADFRSGLDSDNPLGGDSWLTYTSQTIPSLIGAYDSHRYATIYGVENGIYGKQVRARREELSNLDSPAKPYFAGEVGLTARQVSPFTARPSLTMPALRALLDPSATPFVDSQPNIDTFDYGVWMGDMMIQGISSGLSGASAWDLDDAMHVGGGYGSQGLKQWGFWNSLGGQDGYPASDLQPRPWYYAWSILSRAFPLGSQTLATPATGVPGLRVAAARIPNGGAYDLSVAIVNETSGTRTLSVAVPAITGSLTLGQYDYFPSGQALDSSGLPAPARTFSARPSAGIGVQLPANSLAVLTSHGFGTPVTLDQGAGGLTDNLTGWGATYARSRQLKLDRRDPGAFNYARSRATPAGKHDQFLAYRSSQIASFELRAYYAKRLQLLAYGSQDGVAWAPIPLAGTAPAPSVGGHEYLSEQFPAQALPAGVNRLKIVLGPGTELAQVRISAARSGPACLSPALAAPGPWIAGVRPGASRPGLLGLLGAPGYRGRLLWTYCVRGNGELAVVFSRARGAALVLSSSGGYRLGGLGVGTPVAALQRRYGHNGLTAVGRLLVSSAGDVFVVSAGRVEAVGLATPELHGGALVRAAKLTGL